MKRVIISTGLFVCSLLLGGCAVGIGSSETSSDEEGSDYQLATGGGVSNGSDDLDHYPVNARRSQLGLQARDEQACAGPQCGPQPVPWNEKPPSGGDSSQPKP